MAAEVRWTLHALDDAEQIAEYISKDSLHYAQVQVSRFFNRVIQLENFPTAGRVVPELGQHDIRELIEGNYRIIYRIVSESQVDVLTVHHARRLLENNPFLD